MYVRIILIAEARLMSLAECVTIVHPPDTEYFLLTKLNLAEHTVAYVGIHFAVSSN